MARDPLTRKCNICKVRKTLARGFSRNARDPYGRCRECKKCAARKAKLWIEKNKERHVQNMRRQKLAKYGITPDDYDRMWKNQGGVCAICRLDMGKKPHVDHCHKTGVVRGILCFHCNMALGLLKDSVPAIRRAIKYLMRTR